MSSSDKLGAESLIADSRITYTAYPVRWWVLAVYSYASGLQGLLWMTYSSVPDEAKRFLHRGDSTLNLLLNEGPIAYVLCAPFAAWLFGRPRGLRYATLLGCAMCAVAALLRCLPLCFSESSRREHAAQLLWPVYMAQFVNAAAAPFTQAAPALLSQTWFPLSQRTAATGVARMSNSLGRAVGFFLGPALTSEAGMPRLLLVTLAAAVLPLLAAGAHFPAAPPEPPSRTAGEARGASRKAAGVAGEVAPSSLTVRALVGQCALLARDRSVLLLTLAFGVQMGVYGAWSGVLTPVLTAHGLYSPSAAGTLGAVNTFAGIVGGVAVSWCAGNSALATNLKGLMILLCGGSGAAFLVLALLLPPFGSASASFGWIAALSAIAGALRGGLDPIFFELSTEIAYELGAGAGAIGGLLTIVVHIVMIVFLSAPPATLQRSAMLAMGLTMFVCGGLLCFVRTAYARRQHDLMPPLPT